MTCLIGSFSQILSHIRTAFLEPEKLDKNMAVNYEQELGEWIDKENLALELLNAGSHLQLEKSVELVLFRRKLFDKEDKFHYT